MNQEIKQSVMLPLSQLEPNKGQIEGLPQNPRNIKKDKFKKLKQSIIDNPEMLSLRELLVYPHEDKYIVIGGNVAGEIPFTEILNEEHNYIVLYFNDSVNWLQAQTIFDIKPVRLMATAEKEQSEKFKSRYGVGRVIDGMKAIEKLKKLFGNENNN